jgi:hypothetical protein
MIPSPPAFAVADDELRARDPAHAGLHDRVAHARELAEPVWSAGCITALAPQVRAGSLGRCEPGDEERHQLAQHVLRRHRTATPAEREMRARLAAERVGERAEREVEAREQLLLGEIGSARASAERKRSSVAP